MIVLRLEYYFISHNSLHFSKLQNPLFVVQNIILNISRSTASLRPQQDLLPHIIERIKERMHVWKSLLCLLSTKKEIENPRDLSTSNVMLMFTQSACSDRGAFVDYVRAEEKRKDRA